ncbi:hypothetical protein B0H17DRAFT_1332539, partial [Mycena rosella]
MASGAPSASGSPSSANTLLARANFSFTAPLLLTASGSMPPPPPTQPQPLKQRRVSLALLSRLVPAWHFRDDICVAYARKGKVRRLAAASDDEDDAGAGGGEDAPANLRKARRKWTQEETQMRVDRCNIGVGNWKAILSDPNLAGGSEGPVRGSSLFFLSFPLLSFFLPTPLRLVPPLCLCYPFGRDSLPRSVAPHKRRWPRVSHRPTV